DNSSFLELMHRYETRFSRQYDRALRRLLDLQDRRNREPQPPQAEKANLQNETAPAETEPRPPASGEPAANKAQTQARRSDSDQPGDAHHASRLFAIVSPPEVILE
ncbi:MAG TPA: hypothetical protein VFL57_15005, partial [Bryobacteraceae bacterium]|nr:hypothetical protein [Bryobacteraceae bacterium]